MAAFQVALVNQLALEQIQRRFAIQLHVMEGVGDDFDSPNQTSPQVLLDIKLKHAEHQATHTNEQPNPAHIDHELVQVGVRLNQTEQIGFKVHKYG